MPVRKNKEEEEIVREWGVKLAEEIESYTMSGLTPIKTGHLEDALREAGIVLDMAGEKDLARRAEELSRKALEARHIMKATRAITASVEKVRLDAQRFAVDMKRRMDKKLHVDAANPLNP